MAESGRRQLDQMGAPGREKGLQAFLQGPAGDAYADGDRGRFHALKIKFPAGAVRPERDRPLLSLNPGLRVAGSRICSNGGLAMATEPGRELKEQLGEVLMNFAGLEVHLTLFIWCLHGEDPKAGQKVSQMLTNDLSFEDKVVLLQRLFMERFPEEDAKEAIGRLADNIYKCVEIRDEYARCLWAVAPAEDGGGVRKYRVRAKAERGFEFVSKDFDLDKLRKERRFIGETVANVMLYMHHASENDPEFRKCLENGETGVHWAPYKEE